MPDPKVADERFMFYALQAKVPQWLKQRVGVAQPNISQEIIKNTAIPLPPLAEQRRIAAILDKADAIRRKRQQAIRLTETFLRSTFLDMFGDPVANPKGWPIVSVSDFADALEGGKNVKPDDSPSDRTRYLILKVSAVTWGEYRASESKPVPPGFDPPDSYLVQPGDLLISRANTRELIGATVYVWQTPGNIILPDKIWRFVWRRPLKASPLYVHALFNHPAIRHEMGRRASGTSGSMKNITKPKVLSMQVPLPPLDRQREFQRRVEKARTIAERQFKSFECGTRLSDSLISLAFQGGLERSAWLRADRGAEPRRTRRSFRQTLPGELRGTKHPAVAPNGHRGVGGQRLGRRRDPCGHYLAGERYRQDLRDQGQWRGHDRGAVPSPLADSVV